MIDLDQLDLADLVNRVYDRLSSFFGRLAFLNVVELTTDVKGTLPIASGGTGQTAKTAAFDALSPATTKGDAIVFDGTHNVRQPVGNDGQYKAGDSTQAAGVRYVDPATRGMLAGCQLTWVSGTSLTMGAGTARDTADTETMKLASATTMLALTVGWVVGNNQPKVRSNVNGTGTLVNGQTLHAYVIKRMDTGVVDWLLTEETSNPTLPTGYTKSRRVASIRFGAGVATIPKFTQDGDYFRWAASVLDVNTTNPGIAAVTATLSLPTGFNMQAFVNAELSDASASNGILLSDLAANDETPALGAAPLVQIALVNLASTQGGWGGYIRTNTSSQIRYRVIASGASTVARIATLGWLDTRGRND